MTKSVTNALVVVRLGMTFSSGVWNLEAFITDILEAIGEECDSENPL